MGTDQHQTIGSWVRPDVLCDISVRHPRTHDTIRKRCLRNLDNGEHVRMRIGLDLFDCATESLVRDVLSTPLGKRGIPYKSVRPCFGLVPYPKHLDAYLLPTIISLPDIRESSARVAQGFITQF